MRLGVFAAAVAATLALAPGAVGSARQSGQPSDLAVVYDVYFGGIWAGEFTVNAEYGPGSYRAGFDFRTRGVVAALIHLAYSARTQGRIGAGGHEPERFTYASEEDDDLRVVEMTYAGGTPGLVRVDPPFKVRPWSLEAGDQSGIFDPLSAGLTIFGPAPEGAVCNRETEIFDGRRLYAIRIEAPVRQGSRIRCEAVFQRLGGYKPKWMGDRARNPFTMEYARRDDGLYQPARVWAETAYGTTAILLRD